MTNIYCYCIINNPDPKLESFAGIDDNYELYSIQHKDISMIVSNVPQEDFSESRLNGAFEDVVWLSRYAVRHEKIVEHVMRCCRPLLPMKFCSIYRNESRVKTVLESRFLEFAGTLSYLKDKDEYGVKIYVDKDVFKKKMLSDSNHLFKKVEDKNISAVNYLLKRKLENEAERDVITGLSSRKKTIHLLIAEWAADSAHNRIIKTENKTKDKMLIHNASYLVEDRYLENFHNTIKRINDDYENEGFRAEASGPWPCYNFSAT